MVTNVDALTLRCTIVELKDLKGLSFQKIADYIKLEYGIERTRQAIAKMYHTAKVDEESKSGHQKLVCDVVNIYCLLDSALETLSTLETLKVNITYRQLLNIVKENTRYIDCVQHTIIANIKTLIDKHKTPNDILESIKYREVRLSEKRFDQYFEEAYSLYIRDMVLKEVGRYQKLTQDSKKANGIASRFNLDLKTGEHISWDKDNTSRTVGC